MFIHFKKVLVLILDYNSDIEYYNMDKETGKVPVEEILQKVQRVVEGIKKKIVISIERQKIEKEITEYLETIENYSERIIRYSDSPAIQNIIFNYIQDYLNKSGELVYDSRELVYDDGDITISTENDKEINTRLRAIQFGSYLAEHHPEISNVLLSVNKKIHAEIVGLWQAKELLQVSGNESLPSENFFSQKV